MKLCVMRADGRTAIVENVRDDGRAGLLRFPNGQTETQWFLYAEFMQHGMWELSC
jgi:hypothetical protein